MTKHVDDDKGVFNTQLAEQLEKVKIAVNKVLDNNIIGQCPGYITSIRDPTEICLNCSGPRHD